jgi:hypothetical protein
MVLSSIATKLLNIHSFLELQTQNHRPICQTFQYLHLQRRIISLRSYNSRSLVKVTQLIHDRYGTLMGSTFYQSFVNGIISYQALPKPMFSQLQQKIFPVYFAMQTALPAVLALTYPGSRGALGPPSSFSGVLAESNRFSVLVPLATMFITGLANVAYIGPATTRIMRERKVQGMGHYTILRVDEVIDFLFCRNTRRKEIIRPCTTLEGDAEAEQSLRENPWIFGTHQLGRICRYALVWAYSRTKNSIDVSRMLVMELYYYLKGSI